MSRLKTALDAFWKAWRGLEPQNKPPVTAKAELGHLRLLSILQRSGRLVDFLKEDISALSDAQVGAAAREIHRECAKAIEEMVTVRPLYEESEGARIRVPAGFDPSQVKLTGNVVGQPPYEGILVHRGWKAAKRSLPKQEVAQSDVICPAQVEV